MALQYPAEKGQEEEEVNINGMLPPYPKIILSVFRHENFSKCFSLNR
jgi:hypothetical protein